MENFKSLIEAINAKDITWYHGSSRRNKDFVRAIEYVGRGADQEGPGIYFSSNDEDAASYANKHGAGGGVLYTVKLNFNKMLPLKGKVKKSDVIKMVEMAKEDNLESFNTYLSNWGYDESDPTTYKTAYNEAINSMIHSGVRKLDVTSNVESDSPVEVFKNVWWEFYKHNPTLFCKNMASLGYDGFIVPKSFMGVKHAIVFNPKIIKVIDSF